MSSLIWSLTLLMLAPSGLCKVPAPVDLSISSHNFIHLLTWAPGPGSPEGLSYRVEVYALGNAAWLHVPGCEVVVTPLVCNLTGAMPDLRESYFTRVWAQLGNQSSNSTELDQAFIPMESTSLDPPLLSVRVCEDFLCVNLAPPSSQLHHAYSLLHYTLTVKNRKDGAQYTFSTKGLVGEKIKDLEPGGKYCVTVTIAGRKSASSQPTCIEMAVLYSPDRGILIVLSVLVLAFLVVMAFLINTEFICSQTTFPETLVSLKSQDVRLLPSTYDDILCSLLRAEAPPKRSWGGSRPSSTCEEDEEARSLGDAGYERRPKEANQNSWSSRPSSDGFPRADGPILPSEIAACHNVSPTVRGSQDLSGRVTGSGPLLLSLTSKEPLIGSSLLNVPTCESVTDSGPLLLSLTGKKPLIGSSLLNIPTCESVTDGGQLSLSLTKERPPSVSLAENELGPLSSTVVGLRPASVGDGVQADEEGSCLNVKLESVMLLEQEDKEEEDEEEEEEVDKDKHCEQIENVYKHRPFLYGLSTEPLLVPLTPAAVSEPPHTQACSIYPEEGEEDEDEEDENDEDEDFSGYMKRPS